ncbi:hypothetical protein FACS1894120_0990 [Clostridia bacterium]|nr:hypothetical protein FACS1894120_0990 [Clostridia bacterium]
MKKCISVLLTVVILLTTAPVIESQAAAPSHIPAVYITTDSGKDITSKTKYVAGKFSMAVPKTSRYEKVAQTDMTIKGRGNSTWAMPKKPYRIKFNKKISLLGLPKSKDWILLANHADRSLIRNTVAFEAARETGLGFVPTAIPVSLYVNGAYKGVYTLGDAVEVQPGRVELGSNDAKSKKDVGFLLEVGGAKKDTNAFKKEYFHTNLLSYVLVHSPKYGNDLTPAQFKYIGGYFMDAEKAIMNLDGYEDYIDVDSFVDFFLHTELFFNTDSTFYRSCYISKDPGGKLKMAAVWDFDSAIGNYSGDLDEVGKYYNYNRFTSVHGESHYIKTKSWMQYLLKDPAFCSKVKKRWNEIGGKMLKRALSTAEKYRTTLAVPAKSNFQVWQVLGSGQRIRGEANTLSIPTYNGQIDYIEDFLRTRKIWLDYAIQHLPLT